VKDITLKKPLGDADWCTDSAGKQLALREIKTNSRKRKRHQNQPHVAVFSLLTFLSRPGQIIELEASHIILAKLSAIHRDMKEDDKITRDL
jgi:hypothetical protein